jgi:hypothetical protein
MKLFQEAKEIRDGLLQESFTMRRSLDLFSQSNLYLPINKTQEYLKQADNFYHALVKLSDRLFPAYLQDSLPLAIECLLEPWLTSKSYLSFHLDMPLSWRQESVDLSLIILRSLEELLLITLPEVSVNTSVFIDLKQKNNQHQLIVHINYPDVSTRNFYSNLKELQYLCTSFRFLTSRKCYCHKYNRSISFHFYW